MSGLKQTGIEGTQALRYGTGPIHFDIVVYGYGGYLWATAFSYNILRLLPSFYNILGPLPSFYNILGAAALIVYFVLYFINWLSRVAME